MGKSGNWTIRTKLLLVLFAVLVIGNILVGKILYTLYSERNITQNPQQDAQVLGLTDSQPTVTFTPISPSPTPVPARPYLSDDPAIVYNRPNSWKKRSLANNTQYAMQSGGKNSTARLFFRGNSVSVTLRKAPDAGNAKIIIDGKIMAHARLYQDSESLSIYGPYQLRNGVHTVVISVNGEKADKSTNYLVGLYKIRTSSPVVPTPDYRINPIPTINPEINTLIQQQNEILRNLYLRNDQMSSFAQQGADISKRILDLLPKK